MSAQNIMWTAFAVIISVMLVLDLLVNRKSHEISLKEAALWTSVWVSIAFAFNAGVWYFLGKAKALEFLTGYVIEESLSVDNLFVFIMIFSYFGVARKFQPKILKWGIMGALVMRALFIIVGIGLIERFHWMMFIFGGILVFTGVKMAFRGEGKIDPEKNLVVRLTRKCFPITKEGEGDHFFLKGPTGWMGTPLLLALVVIESSDLIFAVDSIPAVLAVTTDPFIVYTSNVFAIMGLRSLYYLLANVMEMFVYLKLGVSFILTFVGAKMLLTDVVEVPLHFSLGFILGVLVLSIVISLRSQKKPAR